MIDPQKKSLHLKRDFHTDAHTLFSAWAQKDSFKAWWKDLNVVDMDFRVGGKYRLSWIQDPNDYAIGEYVEIIPNQKIVFTWNTDGSCSGSDQPTENTVVTVLIHEKRPGLTSFELIHEFFKTNAEVDSHHLGWTCALQDLDRKMNPQDADPKLKVEIKKILKASPEEVFEAWANPVTMNEWFNRDGADWGCAKSDLIKDGLFRMDYQKPDGKVWRHYGQYTEIIPSQKLHFTWTSDHCHYDTQVTVELKKVADTTELTLTHSGFREQEMRNDHEQGWNDCLRSLGDVVQKGVIPAVRITREYNSPVETLFAACSNPSFFGQCGGVTASGKFDFRVGGKYYFEVKGSVPGDYVSGEFTRIVKNRRIELTWNSLCSVGETGETYLNLLFEKSGTGSRLTLCHYGFNLLGAFKDHKEGWSSIVETLIPLSSMEQANSELTATF